MNAVELDPLIQRLAPQMFGPVEIPCMLTGSTVYGPDGVKPSDTDYIAFGNESDLERLFEDDWCVGGSFDHEAFRLASKGVGGGASLKKDGVNIILTSSPVFLSRWLAAHDECCQRRPKTKQLRVAIFREHFEQEGEGPF